VRHLDEKATSPINRNWHLPDWRMIWPFVVWPPWGQWRQVISSMVGCRLFCFQNCKS